jgi:hypothetical protein
MTVSRLYGRNNMKISTAADLAGAMGLRLKFSLEPEEDNAETV